MSKKIGLNESGLKIKSTTHAHIHIYKYVPIYIYLYIYGWVIFLKTNYCRTKSH